MWLHFKKKNIFRAKFVPLSPFLSFWVCLVLPGPAYFQLSLFVLVWTIFKLFQKIPKIFKLLPHDKSSPVSVRKVRCNCIFIRVESVKIFGSFLRVFRHEAGKITRKREKRFFCCFFLVTKVWSSPAPRRPIHFQIVKQDIFK